MSLASAAGHGALPMPARKASSGAPYEGAGYGRRARNWNAPRMGPKTVQYANLETLRDRTYAATRNNPYARNCIKTWVAEAIGTGIHPQSLHPNKKIRKQIEAAFGAWAEESEINGRQSFYGQQATGFGSIVQAGETFARFVLNKRKDTFIPLSLQMIEPDQMPTWFTDQAEGIREGIQFDGNGRITNYHFFKEHPYDSMFFPNAWDRIAVPEKDIVHAFQIDRPGQIRGEPWLTAVIAQLHEIEGYDDAERARKKTTAMHAGFIRKTTPEDNTAGTEDTSKVDPNQPGVAEVAWEPGSLSVLFGNEEIEFSTPPTDMAYDPYMVMQLHAVAAGCDLAYHQLSNDLRRANYSSLRAGLVAFRRKCEQYQHLMFIFQFCRKVYRRVITEAVIAGRLNLPGFEKNPAPYLAARWITPGWDWVDPLKDVQATIAEIQGGLTSRKAEVAARGGDVEQVDRDNYEDTMRAKSLGLAYNSDEALVLGRGENPGIDEQDEPGEDAKGKE